MECIDRRIDGERTESTLRVSFCTRRICRVTVAAMPGAAPSGLNRYGFIRDLEATGEDVTCTETATGFRMASAQMAVVWDREQNRLTVADADGKVRLRQISVDLRPAGSVARFEALPGEDWIGFGDQTRDRLYHRGHIADCHVRNVKSYAPVPFCMSTAGVGILVNTTHRIVFDMCSSDPDRFEWRDGRTVVDYYVFVGDSFHELLDAYTELTGRPKLPPEWAFGLWYICRTQANDYEAVNDAANFRREEIPCDVIGLEPGWMEKNYDASTDKTWSRERFPIPSYAKTGPHNFFNALRRMGFHMELWLCCDYDLSFEAERRIGNPTPRYDAPEHDAFFHPEGELDEHFSHPKYLDNITKREQAWFQHLQAFVDQGADFFKQDGAYQVLDHPDRRWGNGMLDNEMHNLYPLLYARQMLEGFEAHTGRRGLTFTPCGWAGFQAWAGTWTGDTGGGPKTLGAILNTAIVGHSWATNDMEVTQKEALHFGYLLPWAQINSWNYFRMPWLQGAELLEAHRDYSRFRARLIPYIYSWAYHATRTGFPLIAPLTLEFPHDPECREIVLQFLLGRDLMVCAFSDEAYFPEGLWWDMWTGAMVSGGGAQPITWPPEKGGGLYLRQGGIVPFGPLMQYRGERPLDAVDLLVFPGDAPSEFVLYEDDGTSLEHRNGRFATTRIAADRNGETLELVIGERRGDFPGMCRERKWSARIVTSTPPTAVRVDGEPLAEADWTFDTDNHTVTLQCLQAPCRVTLA